LPPNTFSGLKIYGKCVCGRRPALDPAGGAYSFPQTPYLDLRGLLRGRGGRETKGRRGGNKGRRGSGKGQGEEKGRQGERKRREGREGGPPTSRLWLCL